MAFDVESLLRSDPRSIARAITQIENDRNGTAELLKTIFPHTGRALIVGVTGAPGSGKSTLVDRLAKFYWNEQKKSVGIVAVDPTSPFSGGAILGDRIRMQNVSLEEGVFIRSMATRGYLGGLARATHDAVSVLDAAKKDIIIVETVGVGQDEIDVVKLAHINLVLLVPGMGDDIQAIKAGIMEIADIFVVNKADREGVDRIEAQLQAMLSISHRPDGWTPPIVRAIATMNEGTAEVAGAIEKYVDFARASHLFEQKSKGNARERLLQLLSEQLVARVVEEQLDARDFERCVAHIASREKDPYSVVEEIIANFCKKQASKSLGR
ncbi:MAG: methylmalonyl Co-A mutase-associated GTPase MeaB [Acidobacteriia bacterium]|nr:methylmalonyl Co-A mutase-associated GTPase MeaB [Terriglobia bacterium]